MAIKCTVTTDLQAKDTNGLNYSYLQKKVVSFHVFQKLTAFDLAYYVLRL